MRQVWRAEAEKAAEYFSAIPGFGHPTAGHPTAEVPVRPAVKPGPSSPEDVGKPSRRGFLVGLRQRLLLTTLLHKCPCPGVFEQRSSAALPSPVSLRWPRIA